MNYQEKYQEYLKQANDEIGRLVEVYLPQSSEVGRAASYSLLSGGKRVRAVLVMATAELTGGELRSAAAFASGVEMLHCYSLIHDDLPCMDNDDFRRGKPSCHKAFGEATALLAGDALQTAAFECIANAELPAEKRISAVKALSLAAGDRGMVYGQELDLAFENQPVSEEQLREIHHFKTGALINAAIQLGAAAGNCTEQEKELLVRFAFDIGLVFQIVDDVLDVTATAEELGKPIGSDNENGKTTYITLFGDEGAIRLAEEINGRACEALRAGFGEKAEFLVTLAENLVTRRK